MLVTISLLTLICLLWVSIKAPQYSLGIFMLIFSLLPYTIYYMGLNLLYWTIIIIAVGVYVNKGKCKETIKGLDIIAIKYMGGIIIINFFCLIFNKYISGFQFVSQTVRFIFEYILILVLFNHLIIHSKAVKLFDMFLYVSTAIVVIYAYYNYISGINPYRAYISMTTGADVDMASEFQEYERGLLQGRVSSTFVHPLSLGQFILLASSYIVFKLKKSNTIIEWSVIIILISVAFLTGSRSALIPMILLICIYWYSIGNIRKKVVWAAVILIICIVFIPERFLNSFYSMIISWDTQSNVVHNIEGSSIELRQKQLNSLINILDSDIVFGRGLGYINIQDSKVTSEMLGFESIIFEKTFETGIVGLLLYLFFFISSYRIMVKYAKERYNKLRVHALCLPFFLCTLITGMQYGMIVVYIVFFVMTMYNIYNEEKVYKITYYDSKNSSLLLAQ